MQDRGWGGTPGRPTRPATCSALPEHEAEPAGRSRKERDAKQYGNAEPAVHPAVQSPASGSQPGSGSRPPRTTDHAGPSRSGV